MPQLIHDKAIIYPEVVLGDMVHIEAGAYLPPGVRVGDRVHIGPNATFTNDKDPRAFGQCPTTATVVGDDASIGANATIVCGVRIGANALVGAGAVVTGDVPPNAVVVGNPARVLRTRPPRA